VVVGVRGSYLGGVLTIDDVRAAAANLEGVAHRTPVMTSRTLDRAVGARVRLKCESFERGGAFKFGGAYNFVCSLSPEERERGVCAVSSGNHAQAVAIAGRELNIHAAILMPEDAPLVKLEAPAGYGAEVVTYDRCQTPAVVAGAGFARERAMTFVPPTTRLSRPARARAHAERREIKRQPPMRSGSALPAAIRLRTPAR
jgi:threonine dehydratase